MNIDELLETLNNDLVALTEKREAHKEQFIRLDAQVVGVQQIIAHIEAKKNEPVPDGS